ncbi:hypothetical protein NLI96_g7704 [Meripilus lineatus]|uniref:Uncharacterized protein n=1 Tax=Meripilus lineatus TaxID=2056292 RepID=A0AAD5YGZ5_9APHY|nr:hypothetical protein NLI96_g7704 [Physisporinus lineatus]
MPSTPPIRVDATRGYCTISPTLIPFIFKHFSRALSEPKLGSSSLLSSSRSPCALNAHIQSWTRLKATPSCNNVQGSFKCSRSHSSFTAKLKLTYKSNRHMLSYWSPTSTRLMTGVPTSCG